MEYSKTYRVKSLVKKLRDMKIGETAKFCNDRNSVRSTISRLNKQGLHFTTSVVGLRYGVVVKREG